MGRKAALRHRRSARRQGSDPVGYGRLLLVPFVVMRSLGHRAFRWLVLRQQRFMHARSSSDVEATLRNLNIELERSYKTQPSPRPRPPYHLRPRPLRSVWKVYVPRRRLPGNRASFLLKKGHYQIPKRGRPVPVSPDIVKYLTFVQKSPVQRAQEKAGMPKYLCFSNEVNIRDEENSIDGYSSAEEIVSEHSLRPDQYGRATPTQVSFSPRVESDTDSNDSRRNSSEVDDESSSFATSEKISPKLREVVASLRAKASPSLSTSFEFNNLNKCSSKRRTASETACPFDSQASRSSYLNNISGPPLNISNHRRFCESAEISSSYCLSRKSSTNPTVSSDSDNENGVNFMTDQEKNYCKSMLRLMESSSINETETSVYDSLEPFYDVILDSGYSTVVESSQESVRSCSPDFSQVSRVSEKDGGSSVGPESSINTLSRSLSNLKIDREVKSISLDINEVKIHDQGDGIPWKTQSAEELSVSKLVPSVLYSCKDELATVTSTISPEPQKSFLHNVVKRCPVSVTARRMLPPLPDVSLPPLSISCATSVLPSERARLPETGDVRASVSLSSDDFCSPHVASETLLVRGASSSSDAMDGLTSALPVSSISTATHANVSCSLSSPATTGHDSNEQQVLPVACEIGCSIFYLPCSEYSTSSSSENASQETEGGSGDARGASSVPPAKVFPPPATKPATPVSSVSGSPLSIKPPVPSLKKEPQLPPLPSRPVVPPAKPLVQGSSSSKSTAKSPMVNTGGKPSNIGHHSFNEGLNILLRNSPASGTKGNEPLPTPSGPPLGISPAPLHLPPQGIKKPALVTSNRHSDPSASAAKSTTSTIPVSSASNILRRPAPPGGVQLFSLASPSEIQGTTDETEEPEDSQESVRLSDGSRVDLTPLYKSLVQRDFFHLVSRSRAEEMLLENPSDGAFVVRPSSKEHPLTLVVVCQGTCSNICIRQRPDRLFALGAEKHNEVVFKSVDELIEHHLQKPLKLNSGQEVLLTTSPSHHTSYVYVRMPIARLANSIAA